MQWPIVLVASAVVIAALLAWYASRCGNVLWPHENITRCVRVMRGSARGGTQLGLRYAGLACGSVLLRVTIELDRAPPAPPAASGGWSVQLTGRHLVLAKEEYVGDAYEAHIALDAPLHFTRDAVRIFAIGRGSPNYAAPPTSTPSRCVDVEFDDATAAQVCSSAALACPEGATCAPSTRTYQRCLRVYDRDGKWHGTKYCANTDANATKTFMRAMGESTACALCPLRGRPADDIAARACERCA